MTSHHLEFLLTRNGLSTVARGVWRHTPATFAYPNFCKPLCSYSRRQDEQPRQALSMALINAVWSVPICVGLTYLPHFVRAAICFSSKALDNRRPRDLEGQLKRLDPGKAALVGRLAASHNNQLETIGVYAAGVAAAVATKVPAPQLNKLATVYVTARVAFNIAYAAPQVLGGMPRSLSFMFSMGSCLAIWFAAAGQGVLGM